VRPPALLIIGAFVATLSLGALGVLVVFGDSTAEVPTSFTIAETTTTTEAGVSRTLPAPSTTEAATGFAITVELENAPALQREVQAFYSWLADPEESEAPVLPPGLAEHIGEIELTANLALTGTVSRAKLEDESRMAVVLLDEDVILVVNEGSGWQIVGAKMARFERTAWYGPPVRHVMVIGSDARPGESQREFRADSIHIVSAALDESKGAVVGFPRDTYVTASYGEDKFTHVNVRDGTGGMVTVAENISGLEIEGYLITGFQGFTQLVNAFGGVPVDVPFSMAEPKSKAYLDAGLQILDGPNALAFSRNRSIRGGDFTRSFHQGMVILGALTDAATRGIEALPDLVKTLTEYTWTDLTPAQLLTLGAVAFEIDPLQVGNLVLPGNVTTRSGASVVVLDEAVDAIFDDLADGWLSPETLAQQP
jgi:LCP family protein required for cell wall assembly